MSELELKIVHFKDKPDLIKRIAHIRAIAWKESCLFNYPNPAIDNLDEHSIHFVAFEESHILASARVTPLKRDMIALLPNHYAQLFEYSDDDPVLLSRLVTIPQARCRGIARRLTLDRLNYIRKTTRGEAFAFIRKSIAAYYREEFGFEILKEMDQPYPNSCLVHLKNN